MPNLRHRLCPCCRQRVHRQKWRCAGCGGLLKTEGFEVVRELSAAPRGRVYEAIFEGAPVVLKELSYATVPDIEALDAFEREAALLVRLQHPRIPKHLRTFSDGTGPQRRVYLAQSFVGPENLKQALTHRLFAESEVHRIATDVLDGLAYLHSRSPRVVHGDIGLENLILDRNGRCALVDFDTAGATAGSHTPGQLDPRMDLVALGQTLTHLLSRPDVRDSRLDARVPAPRLRMNVSPAFSTFLTALSGSLDVPAADCAAHTQGLREQLSVIAGGYPKTPTSGATVAVESAHEGMPVVLAAQVKGTSPQRKDAPAATVEIVSIGSSAHKTTVAEELPPRIDARSSGVRAQALTPPWRISIGKQTYILEPGRSYLLGRTGTCDLVIDEALPNALTVSRKHAELRIFPRGLRIRDLNSSNGTGVDGRVVQGCNDVVIARDATRLSFGSLEATAEPAYLVLSGSPPSRPRPAGVADDWRVGYLGGDPDGVRIAQLDPRRRIQQLQVPRRSV